MSRIEALRSYSSEDAPIASGPRRYPVAVFLPGAGMRALMYQAVIEDLASHGWVVAAIDPPYNAQAMRFLDGRVFGNVSDAERRWPKGMGDVEYAERVAHWSRDVSFVIDRLTALDNEHGPFERHLDLQHGVAAFGHSFGGVAAGTVRLLDRRVRAAVNLDGSGPDGPYAPVSGPDVGVQPFLWMLRSGPRAESWYPDRLLRPIAGGALRVVLNRPAFAHGDFSDEAFWVAASTPVQRTAKRRALAEVREWVRAFFDATIRGTTDGLQRMIGRPTIVTPNTVRGFGVISRE